MALTANDFSVEIRPSSAAFQPSSFLDSGLLSSFLKFELPLCVVVVITGKER
ncbi:hypothetical protein Hanom_Chr11g00980981 [Helianthus anomalus]